MNRAKPKRACTAKNGRGLPCGMPPIRGGMVCPAHGGRAPQVRRKAEERLADLIDPDRALREAAALAYSDITQVYDEKYQLKPIREWPPALRQAIRKIAPRTFNENSSDGMQDRVLMLETWDKPKALEMLFKYLGLMTERLEHSGGVTIKWES